MKKKLFILSAITIIGLSGCGNYEDKNDHEVDHGANEKSADQDTSQVEFSFDKTPQSATDNDLTIQVNDELGKPIKKFEVEHEKLMHLIVVSEDLSYFDHIHPNYQGDGNLRLNQTFKRRRI
jgi:hypothetical protein